MKRNATLPILACLAALLASGSVFADESLRQVWRDSDQQIVHNTWGNCVRSRWDVGSDPCAPPVVAYQPPPPPPPRTIIAEADRTVYFPFNVASLTPDSQQKLDTLSQRINSASDIQDAQVVGYADRIGTTSYNEKLSKKRADTVRDYLISRNVITEHNTMTRWVGKSESTTQCAPNISHEQLIQCLAPDRKVTVELKYKQQVETAPQTNAAPSGPLMGQPPLVPTAAAHVLTPENSNAVVAPAPYPTDKDNNNAAVQVYPLEQSSAVPVQVIPLPVQSPMPMQSVPQQRTSVEQPTEAIPQQQTSAADMQSVAPPEPQPNSASPAAYETQAAPGAGQYAETAYQASYPPSDHPADQAQPSDQDRERYLTTGE